MPPEIAKMIEYLDREFERRLIERLSIPFGVWNSPLNPKTEPLDFKTTDFDDFSFRCRMDYGVTFIQSPAFVMSHAVDDRPRPHGMPFEVFVALEVLWIRIDLDLFDRRLTHVISQEIN